MLRTGVPLEGAEVCIVGYGDLVGAPLSVMLTQNSIRGNATVLSTHIKTRDLLAHTRAADIVVAAAGVPAPDHAPTWIKPGATVVDVGVHRTPDGLDRRRAVRRGRRGRGGDHAGAGRRRTDDRRDAPGEHRAGRRAPGLRVTAPRRAAGPGARRAAAFVGHERDRPAARAASGSHRSRRTRVGLVGYVDAVNLTDNPTASAHMSPVAAVAVRPRGGHRAHGPAHGPRPQPARAHGRPARARGRWARATCSA